jgi:mRNA interferase RelE/StbE
MEPYSIQWRSSTKKDLRRLAREEVVRVIEAVEKLAEEPFPHGSQKLAGAERTYRIRIGDYRVIYEVETETRTVEIERVRHRKDVYRE